MMINRTTVLISVLTALASTAHADIVSDFGDIVLVEANTGYGQGEVLCPVNHVALGGGSFCSDGDFDTAFPIIADGKPVGWRQHHRGSSSNDCKVRAICVPETEFMADEIKVVSNATGYGQGRVQCGGGYTAIGGGAFCSDGDFSVNYPDMDRSGWNQWHRGASSFDCQAYAVCVRDDHRIAQNSYVSRQSTGYGSGESFCANGDYAIGGGAFCSDGDFDVSYPADDLSSWKEWHRGASSNDCDAYAICLDPEYVQY